MLGALIKRKAKANQALQQFKCKQARQIKKAYKVVRCRCGREVRAWKKFHFFNLCQRTNLERPGTNDAQFHKRPTHATRRTSSSAKVLRT